jgi:hypothetical protein
MPEVKQLIKVDQPLVKVMESNISPIAEIQSSIDRLSADVKEIAKAQHLHLANYHNMDSSKMYSAPKGDTSFPHSYQLRKTNYTQGPSTANAASVRRRTSYAEGDRAHGLRPN